MLNQDEQIQKMLMASQYVLVVFAPGDSGDALASAIALKLWLEKQHKQVNLVASGFTAPKNFKFLPAALDVKPELSHLQKFIIKVDVSKAPIDSLSYDVKDNWLSIYLTPKNGIITKHELRTAQSTFKYDLIITINTPDLASLGDVFQNNSDLFYRVPVINVDYQPSNERYGQINLIDLTATASAEIVYRLLKNIGENFLDAPIATALLTGMIIATKSFKNAHLSPHTLQLASDLVASGADREKIIQHLYRTRSVSALKLWGHALTHLQTDPKIGLVWTSLTQDDFARSGASAEDLLGLVEELIGNSPEAKIILVLYETETSAGKKQIRGLVSADKNYDASLLVRPLHPEGNKKQADFTIADKTLKEAEELSIKTISDCIALRP